jgi:predicted Zn-dependent peptidase
MKIVEHTYENGLRVVFEKNDKNVIGLNILFFVGSQNETKEQEGYSHFIEHLMFKGTEKRTAEELADELSMLGADFNAYTSRTVTRYTLKCLTENFEKCFEIYADMLLNASFRNDDIDKERNVVIEEMKRVQDDPVEVLYDRVMTNYFGENSYAHDELGKEEIISTVSRNQLVDYKNKFYLPKNCVISVTGNTNFETIDQLIKKYFVFDKVEKSQPTFVDFNKFDINVTKKFDIIKRNDNQANVCVHIKSITCDSPLRAVSEIYSCILGNSQNSRLYKRIREELGLVYSIYSFVSMGSSSGELFIMFGTRPENTAKTILEIKQIIQDLATNGILETELVTAKNLKKSSMEYSLETNSEIAEINGSYVHLYGAVDTIQKRTEEIDAVSLEQVNNFAKMIAQEKIFNVVAVGKNLKKKDIECFSS